MKIRKVQRPVHAQGTHLHRFFSALGTVNLGFEFYF
jgi:hypothetical protein